MPPFPRPRKPVQLSDALVSDNVHRSVGAQQMGNYFLGHTSHAQDAKVWPRVGWSGCVCVCVSVSLLDTSVSPAKMDEPIEMPFGLDQGTMYWGRGADHPGKRQFGGFAAH